jgi:hypothetical protein
MKRLFNRSPFTGKGGAPKRTRLIECTKARTGAGVVETPHM